MITALSATPLWAQPAQTAASDQASLETITVTARRKEENLQTAPVAVTAVQGEFLDERASTSIAEIARFTPSLSFDSAAAISGSSNAATIFIRGIGQTDFNLTIDPGVGIYLDGVYISRAIGGLLNTLDLDSVQVLRGPQGTLFGKNTIGGALVLTTKAPVDYTEGFIEGVVGEFERRDLRAGFNAPINDRLAVRVTGAWQNREGYVTRLVDGDDMGDEDSLFGRIAARAELTDALTLDLAFDATREREKAAPLTQLRAIPGDVTNPAEPGLLAFFNNVLLNGAQCALPPAGPGVPPSGDPNATSPSCFNEQFVTGDPYTTFAVGTKNQSDLDVWGANATFTWDGRGLEAKSITAFRSLDSEFFYDTDASPLTILQSDNDYSQEQLSQEFQLTGEAISGRLDWLVGLFYMSETGTDVNSLTLSAATVRSGGEIDNESYAAFAQLGFDVTEKLSVTLGGRVTHEEKRFTPDQRVLTVNPIAAAPGTGPDPVFQPFFFTNPVTSAAAGAPTPLQPGDLLLPAREVTVEADEFTPSLTIAYAPLEDVFTYVTYSEGFKSGGFTQRVFPPEPVTPSFEPEYVKSLEVGFKSTVFDGRARFNAALFQTNYEDLQIVVREGIAPKVRNAGEARIRGVEGELTVQAHERVLVGASVGYLDAEYEEVDPAAAGVTRANKLANAPEWTASAYLSADLYRGPAGAITFLADWSYKDDHYKDAVNTPELFQEGYSLVGASLIYRDPKEDWEFGVGVTNLTDEEYLLTGYEDLEVGGFVNGVYAKPREWYARLRYNF